MRKPACSISPSSSSWTFSSTVSSASSSTTSSAGSCYAPPPSWTTPRQHRKERMRRRSDRTRAKKNARAVPRMTTSIYRGVTRHKGSGKFEAHLWDKHAWSETSKKKGKQGAYESEEAAARAYDLAALKYWGSRSVLNFPLESYKQELEKMQRMTRERYLATLRRWSSGFSRGASEYRGVTKHHHNGRWEARIGLASGKKYIYLGTFGSQEEAARAYDLAALKFRGHNALTNFDVNSYDNLQPPAHRAQPWPALLQPAEDAQPTPLLKPKPEPEDDGELDPAALPLGPVLLDADDVDHAIAEILPALCMDPDDFEARYPARAPGCLLLQQQSDDLRGLPLTDGVMGFEDDIEALFDAAAAAPGSDPAFAADGAVSGSLASGRWRPAAGCSEPARTQGGRR